MAHELDTTATGEARMAYNQNNGTPWHRLGQAHLGYMTAQEVMEKTFCDFEVVKRKVFVQDSGVGADATMKEVPGSMATVRTDTEDVLGIVGDNYNVLQNRDAFKFFDPIVDRKEAIYDSAGVLRGGRTIWLSAKLPDSVVLPGDDVIDMYLMFANSHDATSAVRAMFTPVRVVCQNTLNMATYTGCREVRIRHDSSLEDNLREATAIMGLYRQSMRDTMPTYRQMMEKSMNLKAFQAYTRMLWAEPVEAASTRAQNNFDRREVKLVEAYNRECERGFKTAGTVWSGYQAITDYIDHSVGARWSVSRSVGSKIFGTYASKRREAFSAAVELSSN